MTHKGVKQSLRIEMNPFMHHEVKWMPVLFWMVGVLLWLSPFALANHRGSDGHGHFEVVTVDESAGHSIPGASFQVYWLEHQAIVEAFVLTDSQVNDTLQTVINAFSMMVNQRAQYRRFNEALTKGVLQKVIIEPQVFNRDGKEFLFLVARTKLPGQVKLLINASVLKEKGLVNQPGQLATLLAREFQWVVSKADTSKKRQATSKERNLTIAPIQRNAIIASSTGGERQGMLQVLFASYLTTVDAYNSLEQQPYYETGSNVPVSDVQSHSAIRLYDIRMREALQRIVRESYFLEHTPKAVRSLLNGKIWNVTFVHIDSRDWATRTRVLPKDQAVQVGKKEKIIQPAKVLINLHRKAVPDDQYYALTNGLPMGALSPDQLARVIALEIEAQIIEKSMRGHVAEDARTAK